MKDAPLITKADYDKFIAPHIKSINTEPERDNLLKAIEDLLQSKTSQSMSRKTSFFTTSNFGDIVPQPYLDSDSTILSDAGEAAHSAKMTELLNWCSVSLNQGDDLDKVQTILGSFEALDHVASNVTTATNGTITDSVMSTLKSMEGSSSYTGIPTAQKIATLRRHLANEGVLSEKDKLEYVSDLVETFRSQDSGLASTKTTIGTFITRDLGADKLSLLQGRSPAMKIFVKKVKEILKKVGLGSLADKLSKKKRILNNLEKKHHQSKSPYAF